MGDDQPKPNPLGPYYPSEVPAVPGNARTWFVVLLALLFLAGVGFRLLTLVV